MPSLRDRRLQSEHATLSSYMNPNIRIVPVSGNPPDQYRITYSCRGVTGREFSIGTRHQVRLEFPGTFPKGAPKFFAESSLWHPNIWDTGLFCLRDTDWNPAMPVSDLLVEVGQLIEFQHFNLNSIANFTLGRDQWDAWMDRHAISFPLGTTDFGDHRQGIPVVVRDRNAKGLFVRKESDSLPSILVKKRSRQHEESEDRESSGRLASIIVRRRP